MKEIKRPVRKTLPATNKEVARVKRRFQLSDKALALALRVSAPTVRSWVRKIKDPNFRKAPAWAAREVQSLEQRLVQ